MPEKVTLIIFVGRDGGTPVERLVTGAHQAVALDTIEKALACDACGGVIVATGSAPFAERVAQLPVTVELDAEPFHFGFRLRELIRRYQVAHPFYVGGGSTPLLSRDELASICYRLPTVERALFANNFFSSDFVAFTPGEAMELLKEPPAIDNDLALLLQRQAGLENRPLERTVGTQFDIDTPTDLMVLSVHPALDSHARRYLADLALDVSHLHEAMRYITDPSAEVLVAGRVGSHVLAHLETDMACRTRVYSEERGMRASGREERGEVRSLLGYYIDAVGPRAFFAALAQMSQAAFIDSRVLFHHWRLVLTAADRFHSDLLAAEEVAHPLAREFTLAAREAPLPVILGGHSLVSGGLWALAEAAWQEKDQGGS